MKNFKELNFPKFLNLLEDLNRLISSGIIDWGTSNQICLNTTLNEPDNFKLGIGSLDHDWAKAYVISENGVSKTIVPKKQSLLSDKDSTVLCPQFKGTEFELLYEFLNSEFKIGRIRLMKSESKTCLSWHVDHTPRIHYPIKTQPGCFMVIDDEVKYLPEHTWWWTNTVKDHTAFNASKESRIHIVACLLVDE